RGRPCCHPGEDPRLRPRQAAPPCGRQGRRSGAAGAIPRRRSAAAQGRGVTRARAATGNHPQQNVIAAITLLLCGRFVGTEVGHLLVPLSPFLSWTWVPGAPRHGPLWVPEHAY